MTDSTNKKDDENEIGEAPKGWSGEVWRALMVKLEGMDKHEILKAYADLGIKFQKPAEELKREDILAVTDELVPEEVRNYFKL